jgi:DNA-binding response OmpR family regulator
MDSAIVLQYSTMALSLQGRSPCVEKQQLSIVVIDDSPTICKIIEVILSREGYRVQTFTDPVIALRDLKTGNISMPDILFVDLLLPRTNGYRVIKCIRRLPAGKHIPIIVISRLTNFLDRLKAKLVGASDYLEKPFTVQQVIATVEKHQAKKNA